MPDSPSSRGHAASRAPALSGGAVRELESLHKRARHRLERQLGILELERQAVLAGDARKLRELAELEAEGSSEIAAIERVIGAFERALPSREAGPELEECRSEHERLRSVVLAANRGARDLLRAELAVTARLLVARRSRAGAPSPYASIGEAAFVDLRR